MYADRKQNASTFTLHGFTLVELLVAIGILLILTTMSVAVYTMTSSSDRIRSSARQVQSAFGGALSRAIKASKESTTKLRGLRLLVDQTDPTIVTSFVYVGTEGNWTEGSMMIGREDAAGGAADGIADSTTVRTLRGWYGTGWKNLFDQGLLTYGSRIKIQGTWYTVDVRDLRTYSGSGPEILYLNSDFQTPAAIPFGTPASPSQGADTQWGFSGFDDDGDGTVDNFLELGAARSDDQTDINAFSTPFDYELQLKPTVLPSQEPLRLSSGIAIDLYNSTLPPGWYQELSLARGSPLPTANADRNGNYNGWGVWAIEGADPSNAANDIYRQYSPRMDIMFAGQGPVVGPIGATGMIHLRLAELDDILQRRDPANPESSPMLYSTLFTQTGFVGTFPVDTRDSNSDQIADNPLYFARTGGLAGR